MSNNSDEYVGVLSVDDLIKLRILADERAKEWVKWWRQSEEDKREQDAIDAYNNQIIYRCLEKRVQQAIEDAKPVD